MELVGGFNVANERPWLKAQVDEAVMEQLRAIAVSSPNGRMKQADMVRKAVEEFIARRIDEPAVQQALASIRGQPLRLEPSKKKKRADS